MRNVTPIPALFFAMSFFLFALLIGSGCFLFGLDPAMNTRQYDLQLYTTENGLPQSSILCIIQTRDGYIWMGTYEGVARFDGMIFTVFNTTNTPEMAGNRIKAMLEDRQGRLWIATSGGLLSFTGGRFTNFTTENGLSHNYITTLYEDRSGRLWIGTTQGLNCFYNNTFTQYLLRGDNAVNYIAALVEDNSGHLWVGTTENGLFQLQNGKFIRPPVLSPLNIEEYRDIRALFRDHSGHIWIGTGGKGVLVESNGYFKTYSIKDGLSDDDIRAFYQDKHNTLWIGTNGQGLTMFKNNAFSPLTSQPEFLDTPIRSMLEDREGSLWVGTRDGLSQLKEGKFIIYNKRGGLPVDSIRTLFQDNMKNIWLGTGSGGLVRISNGSFTLFGLKEGLKSLLIWTIAESKDGTLWVGTYGGGLHCLKDNRVIQIYTTKNGLSNDIIRAVHVDPNNQVWVGSNGGGIDLIDPEKKAITHFNAKNGLSDNFVYAISSDKNGNTWVGTYYGGLNCIRDGMITVYPTEQELSGNAIWDITPDQQDPDKLWLGTDGSGLLYLKKGNFTRFTAKNGLYSDQAFTVIDDFNGNLWMNSNKGIYSLKKKDLSDFEAGKITQIPCSSYGKAEGFQNTECAGPAQPAGLLAHNGTLWFPTTRGAVMFDPTQMKTNPIAPLVVIEEVRVDGKRFYSYPHPLKQRLTLPAGTKRVEFKYTGLSYMDPDRVRFQCRLDGFDAGWINTQTNRTASYTNIEPGNYSFQVKACNNDGLWNEKATILSLSIRPFIWQTWWFQLLVAACFAVLSYLVIAFIKNHIKLITFWEKKKYIGPYEIDEQIGSGGMGIVYKVHSLIDKTKIYAMKVMKDEFARDEVQIKRFKNESALVDRINHPNVVKVQERGEDNGKLYIVMELLHGQTLGERYEAEIYPSVSEAIHILAQVAHILVTVHRETIVHRDLKPENIMLINVDGDPDYVKLLDFGIAWEQNLPHLTESGNVMGTISYLPPEVIHHGAYSPAVDIYSLGIIAYEMLTRQKPFMGAKLLETMMEIMTHVPPAPKTLNPKIPLQLNHLIMDMIAKEPLQRPDARSVLTILAVLIEKQPDASRAQ